VQIIKNRNICKTQCQIVDLNYFFVTEYVTFQKYVACIKNARYQHLSALSQSKSGSAPICALW